MATLAPSSARRLAIAAPIPRESPVTRATFWVKFDIESPLFFVWDLSDCLSDAIYFQADSALVEYQLFPTRNAYRFNRRTARRRVDGVAVTRIEWSARGTDRGS